MSTPAVKTRPAPAPGVILSRATVRAARLLAVAQADLAQVIGVSGATLSRLAHGRKALEPGSKPVQLAALFVRLFRSLDAIVGSDAAAARAGLRSDNHALGGAPRALMREPAGLVRTVDYLDAARARIWGVPVQPRAVAGRRDAAHRLDHAAHRLARGAGEPRARARAEQAGAAADGAQTPLSARHAVSLPPAHQLAFPRAARGRSLVRRGGAAYGVGGEELLATALS